jgi:hypothetical protein
MMHLRQGAFALAAALLLLACGRSSESQASGGGQLSALADYAVESGSVCVRNVFGRLPSELVCVPLDRSGFVPLRQDQYDILYLVTGPGDMQLECIDEPCDLTSYKDLTWPVTLLAVQSEFEVSVRIFDKVSGATVGSHELR